MSPNVRRAAPRCRPRPLSLEPLEDRVLLSAGAAGWGNSLNQAAAAAAPSSSDTSADADAPPGGYVSAQPPSSANATAQVGPQPSAQATSSHPATASAGYASSTNNAYTPEGQAGYAESSSGYASQRYARAAAGDSYTESYPPARTTSPSSSARTAEPGLTAIPGTVPSGAPVQTPVRLVANAALPLTAVPVPQAAAAAPPVVAGQAEVSPPAVQPHGEARPEGPWSGFLGGSLAQAEASPASTVAEPEAVPLFPLALPMPGWLIAGDLSAWERGVHELFRRLDRLTGEGDEASLGRLAPWCAALGAMTLALELTRRRLGKRYPDEPAAARGRGLAWSWSHDPQGRPTPE